MKRVPAVIETPFRVVTEEEGKARHGEIVEFADPPPFFDSLYVQNAIKWRVAETLDWFKVRMVNGEANAKDMDVQLKYLEFAQMLGANQSQDPMEKFRALDREVTRSITVKETIRDG